MHSSRSWLYLTSLVAFFFCSPGRAEDPKPRKAIGEELKALKGIWQTEQWGQATAKGYQLQVAVHELNEKEKRGVYSSITFHLKQDKNRIAEVGFGTPVQIKEDTAKGKRWYELDESYAKVNKVPQRIYYRPDGERLVIVLEEGTYQGEYKLSKLQPTPK